MYRTEDEFVQGQQIKIVIALICLTIAVVASWDFSQPWSVWMVLR